MRVCDLKMAVLIFVSGKLVVTGAKSEDNTCLASRKSARIVQKLEFDPNFSELKIQNTMGSRDFSSFEPELFPGLTYSMIKPKVVLLIFMSRMVVLTRAKVHIFYYWEASSPGREEIYTALTTIYTVLYEFQEPAPAWSKPHLRPVHQYFLLSLL
ncbi:hypothetical protein CERSUDRAFT_95784 [Gelatoporia subvermispora B]|uniref:TATA-box binding protein n=1 Tax=Ceriporiopsis subvermispora (strain B) TaxID=914234 RepID=M2PJU3_CERS8|nr:hypothetical protein CERSUDRAFT_95784 [Gelatoporia subvermispora B]